ncbi:hypothetical protein LRL17_03925 [Rhodococcus qingshengii]|nr:hypothetical protein [Rhodococcus qingshengii]UGQ52890.1 hypothetical protein LRL17_03925 [Rhodococcus qingshengii]
MSDLKHVDQRTGQEPEDRSSDVLADRQAALHIAAAEAVRWSGLLDRLAK